MSRGIYQPFNKTIKKENSKVTFLSHIDNACEACCVSTSSSSSSSSSSSIQSKSELNKIEQSFFSNEKSHLCSLALTNYKIKQTFGTFEMIKSKSNSEIIKAPLSELKSKKASDK